MEMKAEWGLCEQKLRQNGICVNRKGGTRGSRWVHLKGENNMVMSGFGFSCRQALKALGRQFLLARKTVLLTSFSGCEAFLCL